MISTTDSGAFLPWRELFKQRYPLNAPIEGRASRVSLHHEHFEKTMPCFVKKNDHTVGHAAREGKWAECE